MEYYSDNSDKGKYQRIREFNSILAYLPLILHRNVTRLHFYG